MRGAGRRSGSPDTRAEIVDAAREAFSDSGYDGASIRKIAAAAGVDPALVYHYFEGKGDLFAASIDLPFNPRSAIAAAFEGPIDEVGERLATMFVSVWAMDEPREALIGIIRSTMGGNRRASEAIKHIVIEEIIIQMESVSPGPDVGLRALGMVSQLIGMAMLRYVIEMEPFVSASPDDLVRLVAPRLQTYVSG
jgi:AcrR family transcriptional regulator